MLWKFWGSLSSGWRSGRAVAGSRAVAQLHRCPGEGCPLFWALLSQHGSSCPETKSHLQLKDPASIYFGGKKNKKQHTSTKQNPWQQNNPLVNVSSNKVIAFLVERWSCYQLHYDSRVLLTYFLVLNIQQDKTNFYRSCSQRKKLKSQTRILSFILETLEVGNLPIFFTVLTTPYASL